MAVQDPSPIAAKAAHPFVVPGELQAERRRRVARVKRAIRRQTSGGVQHLNVELNGDTLVLSRQLHQFLLQAESPARGDGSSGRRNPRQPDSG